MRFTDSTARFYQIRYSEPDEPLIGEVQAALHAAGREATRWGPLQHGITVLIHPDHEALELAVRQHGFPWLRAWAQYDVIHLQSPRTWGISWSEQLPELLTHELTHMVMYQLIGDRRTWMKRKIPFWFREGMASWTARQGYRRLGLDVLREQLEKLPEANLDQPDPALLRIEKDLAYGASHWAFSSLVQEVDPAAVGEVQVGRVLREIGAGRTFDEAFLLVYGFSPTAFLSRWRQQLRQETLRSGSAFTEQERARSAEPRDRS